MRLTDLGLSRGLRSLLSHFGRAEQTLPGAHRGPVTHVIIIDGTMSSLREGHETNAGLAYKLISEVADQKNVSVRYEAGIQWHAWRTTFDVMAGRGINRQIRRVYGFLASRYHPGDRIFFLGYSRGAYAVRSLAGMIDLIGLLKREHATERMIQQAYRHYQTDPSGAAAQEFRKAYCLDEAPIEMVGVWDTVKALGFRLPIIWRWQEDRHSFHNHTLGHSIRHGFHALALDETRAVFEPVLWTCPDDKSWSGHVEQVWFHGHHGIIGGQLGGHEGSRPLANIPLLWVLEKARGCDLPLPDGLEARFPTDPCASAVGTFRGWGRLFVIRRKRRVLTDPSESIHPSVEKWRAYEEARKSRWWPRWRRTTAGQGAPAAQPADTGREHALKADA